MPVTDDLGRVLDLDGRIIQVWCLPGAGVGTLSIVPQGTTKLDIERVDALIRSLQTARQRMLLEPLVLEGEAAHKAAEILDKRLGKR